MPVAFVVYATIVNTTGTEAIAERHQTSYSLQWNPKSVPASVGLRKHLGQIDTQRV